jgi:RimJ/RimL family protein N-acetyltransferase
MSRLEQLVEMPVAPKGTEPEPPTKIDAGEGKWVDVIPYNANFDPNAHLFLPWFFRRLANDDLLSLYFPGDPDKAFAAFVSIMSSAVTQVLLVVLKVPAADSEKNPDGEVTDTVGFASWTPIQLGVTTVGNSGFIFLKEHWNRKTTEQAAERIMEWWFRKLQPSLDMTVGFVAEDNTLAQRFMQRMGWTRMTPSLPHLQYYAGKQCDAALWFMTREQYESRQK